MVFLKNKNYNKIKEFLLSKEKFDHLSLELHDFILDKYNLKILYHFFEKLKSTSRLFIIVSNKNDYQKFRSSFESNKNYQKEISNKYLELANKYNLKKIKKLSELLVVFIDFSEEAKSDANLKAKNETKTIKDEFKDIWNIYTHFTSVVVFFYKNDDVERNKKNGLCDEIKSKYFKILKKFDDFDYYDFNNFEMKFDSKENLDKNYEGSPFYYFR